jgi:hypothetical protein
LLTSAAACFALAGTSKAATSASASSAEISSFLSAATTYPEKQKSGRRHVRLHRLETLWTSFNDSDLLFLYLPRLLSKFPFAPTSRPADGRPIRRNRSEGHHRLRHAGLPWPPPGDLGARDSSPMAPQEISSSFFVQLLVARRVTSRRGTFLHNRSSLWRSAAESGCDRPLPSIWRTNSTSFSVKLALLIHE